MLSSTEVRCERILNLIIALQSGGAYTTSKLAAELAVSRRTIFRDIKLIRRIGIPVYFDDDSDCYKIRTSVLSSKEITADEVVALILATQHSKVKYFANFQILAESAIAKIISSYSEKTRLEIGNLFRSCSSPSVTEQSCYSENDLLAKVLKAIRNQIQLRLFYISLNDEIVSTQIAPYQLVATNIEWKLVGRSSTHRAIRSFQMNQITKVEIVDEHFKVPQGYYSRNEIPVSATN